MSASPMYSLLLRLALALALLLAALSVARAANPTPPAGGRDVNREVTHLIQFVQQSGCRFFRNGSWYPGEKAGQHLRLKYDYFEQRGQISTAEDFINKAASRSSASGEEYRVRCANEPDKTSRTWLQNELARYRAMQPASGPAGP